MTVSVSTTPTDAVAGLPCRVALAATAGNHVRLWCTDAPTGSSLKKALEESGAARVSFAAGVDAGKDFEFTADVGGIYRIQAEEIQRGAAAYGGGYKGDPNAAPSETILGTTGLSLAVATPLTATLGVGRDTAELLVYVKNANVILTRQDIQGVVSPAIREASSPKALVALNATDVQTQLANLGNASAAALLGSLSAVFNDLRANFVAHATSDALHFSADTVNVVSSIYASPASEDRLIEAFGVLRNAVDYHLRNDDSTATPSGTGTGGFHNAADGVVALLAPPPSDIAGCVLLAADLHRVHEAHRARTSIHQSADTVNAAAALPALLALHSAFLASLASLSPTTPNNEHAGLPVLVNGAGFQRA